MNHDQTTTDPAERDHDWVQLPAVRASLSDFIEDIDHGGRLDVRIPPGTIQIERDGHEWQMTLYGRGGGFCWSQAGCTKRRVLTHVQHYQKTTTLTVRRHK